MAGINDYSNTAGSNTTINGIDISEGCSPAGINNAIRQLMADIADVDDGVVPLQTPDINGGTIDGAAISGSSTIDNSIIGGTTPAAGTFTTLTANTSITGTLNTASQPNITSVGTLSSATVSGDLTVDTDTLYVDSADSRVGFGTTAPGTLLDASKNNATQFSSGGDQRSINVLTLRNANETQYTFAGISLYAGAGTGADWTIANVRQANYEGDLVFKTRTGASGWSEKIRVKSSGSVGIGESSPLGKVHIKSADSGATVNAAVDDLVVENSGDTGITILSGTTNTGGVMFGDSGNNYMGGMIYQHNGNNLIFKGNGDNRMTIDSSGNVVIGSGGLDVSGIGGTYTALNMRAGSGYSTIYGQTTATATNKTALSLTGATSGASAGGAAELLGVIQIACESDSSTNATGYINFYTGSGGGVSEAMRIDSSGRVLIGDSNTASYPDNAQKFYVSGSQGANIQATVGTSGGSVLNVNRTATDGDVIRIMHGASTEGVISISGATVSYGGFTGSHWSRLSDNSKPTILKGTILESLDEMMDWYQVQFDITDEEGNTITKKESYALGDGKNVGDVITYNYNTGKQDDEGNDIIEQVQATIIQEADIKHTKAKISDTVDAKNVYGVFSNWDDGDDTVNDMNVAQTGTFVIRMNSAETVSKGDLIQSNGDGTGKVQADDIIRASTVAKVLSTTKIETYEDGSYIVPCSLHC